MGDDGEAWASLAAGPCDTTFTAAMGAAICAQVAAGRSVMAVCRAPGFPHRTTVRNWVRAHPGFAGDLAAAMRTARMARRLASRAERTAFEARPPAPRGGSASRYTPATGQAICARIAEGQSVVAIGRDPAMPCAGTIYGWVRRHPEFEAMYVQARELQADYLFDEAREVALAATPKTVWADRLRFDVIRWQAARLAPRKYCERLVVGLEQARALEGQGEPLTVVIRRFTPEGVTWDEPVDPGPG